ncbi:MAG: molybdopterin-guanine dinucleotide biosynthesis protein A, partial [Alphaproteobacteria bacterium]
MHSSSRHWAAALGLILVLAAPAAAQTVEKPDRHVGYYYPPPATTEVYTARAGTLPDSDRPRRVGFVTGLTNRLLAAPHAPQFAIFAKGEEAEKLIIVGLRDGGFNTIYRARALFAMLTAIARFTPVFQETGAVHVLTFFDLAKMLGFKQITVTDGAAFAHQ